MKSPTRLWILMMSLALANTGCGGGAVGAVAWSLAMAGVSRAQGGCYSSCYPGTTCNRETGYCDPLPCRGECLPHERCVQEGAQSRCVYSSQQPAK